MIVYIGNLLIRERVPFDRIVTPKNTKKKYLIANERLRAIDSLILTEKIRGNAVNMWRLKRVRCM